MRQLFGVIDIFVGLMFWIYSMLNLIGWHIIPKGFIIMFGIILLIKGLAFAVGMDFLSILDVIAALIILASVSVTFPAVIAHMVVLFLVGKGIFSLAG